MVPPNCKSDEELEYLATLSLETGRTPATRVTGYFKKIIPNLLDGTFKKEIEHQCCLLQFMRGYYDGKR